MYNIGCDIEKKDRIRKQKDSFFGKYFTEKEIDYAVNKADKFATFAGLFCAKEAVLKCLKLGLGNGVSLIDIEILHDENNAPKINIEKLNSKLKNKISNIDISISHCDDTAMAVCVIA